MLNIVHTGLGASLLERRSCLCTRTSAARSRGFRCRAEGSADDPNSVIARIKKAKQYGVEKGEEHSIPSESQEDGVLARFGELASQQAELDAQAFLEAQQQLSAAAAARPPPPPSPAPATAGGGGGSLLQERLRAAREYKERQAQQAQAPAQAPAPQQQPEQGAPAAPAALLAGVDGTGAQSVIGGGPTEAAEWLQAISASGTAEGLDTSLSEEQFTIRKEERRRQQGVSQGAAARVRPAAVAACSAP